MKDLRMLRVKDDPNERGLRRPACGRVKVKGKSESGIILSLYLYLRRADLIKKGLRLPAYGRVRDKGRSERRNVKLKVWYFKSS